MAIIVSEESVIALSDVPKHVPVRRGGKKLHKATPFRWAKDGVRGVQLETIRIGGTLCTSVEALQRFFERLTVARDGDPAPAPVRTLASCRKAAERADRECQRLGI